MTIKNNPNVSIIIPTYNRANLIKRSVNSVFNQTYIDYEIIIVDDGSTDNTKNVIESFNDNRIRYIKHKRNKGAAQAMNTGIKASKGNFVAFQGSDDEWLPEKLEKEMQIFEVSPQRVGVVYSGLWSFENNTKVYKPYSWIPQKDGNIHNELLKGNFVNGLSVIKKECLNKSGLFDESLYGLEDWELYLRISRDYEFRFINEPLIIAHNAQGNISTNYLKLFEASNAIIKKHFEEFNKDKKILAISYANLGSMLYLGGDEKKARNYFLKAVKLDNYNLKYLSAYIFSFLGKRFYSKILQLYNKYK